MFRVLEPGEKQDWSPTKPCSRAYQLYSARRASPIPSPLLSLQRQGRAVQTLDLSGLACVEGVPRAATFATQVALLVRMDSSQGAGAKNKTSRAQSVAIHAMVLHNAGRRASQVGVTVTVEPKCWSQLHLIPLSFFGHESSTRRSKQYCKQKGANSKQGSGRMYKFVLVAAGGWSISSTAEYKAAAWAAQSLSSVECRVAPILPSTLSLLLSPPLSCACSLASPIRCLLLFL